MRRWLLLALLLGCGGRAPAAEEPDEELEEEDHFVEGEPRPPAPPVRRPEPPPMPLETADARSAFQHGEDAYNLGDYETAVGYYKATYELLPDPVLLFDIAQAFRMMDDCYNAVVYYRRYLAASPEAKNRDRVDERLAALLSRCPDA